MKIMNKFSSPFMAKSPLKAETQEFMGKNQLVDRLGAQVGDQDLADNILKSRGDMNPDGSLTLSGRERDNMTAGERAKDRAASESGKNPNDYIYSPQTNSTVLARRKGTK